MTTSDAKYVSPFALEYSYKRSLGPVLSRFMTSLRDKVILGARTKKGTVIVPPAEYDPETGEATEELVPVGPAGTVTSWCWVGDPSPEHPLDGAFAWALIKLDGADTAMLHAVSAEEAQLSTGVRVSARWKNECEGTIHDIVCFEVVP